MANRMRSEVKERLWRGQVSSWQRSGSTIREYCLHCQLSDPNLYAWRRVLAQRDVVAFAPAPHAKRSVTWMPVTVTSSTLLLVEVLLPSGAVLRVPAGVQALLEDASPLPGDGRSRPEPSLA